MHAILLLKDIAPKGILDIPELGTKGHPGYYQVLPIMPNITQYCGYYSILLILFNMLKSS